MRWINKQLYYSAVYSLANYNSLALLATVVEVAGEETYSFNMFGVREHVGKTNCLKGEASIHNKPRVRC